nr:transcription factor rlm1 [Quercus suber]POF20078.1 transcription factor rlm1 [Quercus suber]
MVPSFARRQDAVRTNVWLDRQRHSVPVDQAYIDTPLCSSLVSPRPSLFIATPRDYSSIVGAAVQIYLVPSVAPSSSSTLPIAFRLLDVPFRPRQNLPPKSPFRHRHHRHYRRHRRRGGCRRARFLAAENRHCDRSLHARSDDLACRSLNRLVTSQQGRLAHITADIFSSHALSRFRIVSSTAPISTPPSLPHARLTQTLTIYSHWPTAHHGSPKDRVSQSLHPLTPTVRSRDDRNRSVTFLKRKGGLFKKAHELSVLCSVDVAVIIFGHNKKLYDYSSSDIGDIVGRFQYTTQYGGAHEHKGPADFVDKNGGGDDDDDDDAGGEEGTGGGSQQGTPAPEHPMMHAQMQNHPGFQNVRHGTPSGSPPTHNGAIPQIQRGPSPMPPTISRPASRTDQHHGHIRRTSSNLVPPHMQQSQGQPAPSNYAYTPNAPFYNPNGQPQMPNRLVQQGHQATYPPAYQPSYQAPYAPPAPPPHQHMQQAYLQDNRRASMPPAFSPQPPPQANMSRHQPQEQLQIPPQGRPPNQSPQPHHRPTPSPQPPQNEFASPPLPQPKPLPAHAKSHSIFTPIDDSRSMLAQHWTSSNPAEMPRSDPVVKMEGAAPRPASVDVATIQRGKAKAASPRPPPARGATNKSPLPAQKSKDSPRAPAARVGGKSTANQSEAKRPRLKVQIPSEQSGDEGGTASGQEDQSAGQTTAESQQQGPSHGVVLPPPSPSAGALLSAGAQGPPNPFARPAPPMSTNPHAMRESNHIETPISALPSRFMSDNLLPSPSTFYPEWGFGRSGDSNMLPSPLNFQTPVVPNGQGWREEDRKRANDEELAGNDPKRSKT